MIHQSVEIRAVISNHYSFIMNLNVINQTWALVNNITPFSKENTKYLILKY